MICTARERRPYPQRNRRISNTTGSSKWRTERSRAPVHPLGELRQRFLCSNSANIRARACAQPAGRPGTKLNSILRQCRLQSLCIGVANHKINTLQLSGDHVVYGVAAAAADANDGDLRAQRRCHCRRERSLIGSLYTNKYNTKRLSERRACRYIVSRSSIRRYVRRLLSPTGRKQERTALNISERGKRNKQLNTEKPPKAIMKASEKKCRQTRAWKIFHLSTPEVRNFVQRPVLVSEPRRGRFLLQSDWFSFASADCARRSVMVWSLRVPSAVTRSAMTIWVKRNRSEH